MRLAQTAFTGWGIGLVGLVAIVAAVRFKVNPALLVLGGAIAGWLLAS